MFFLHVGCPSGKDLREVSIPLVANILGEEILASIKKRQLKIIVFHNECPFCSLIGGKSTASIVCIDNLQTG